jgi:hypothetical protein
LQAACPRSFDNINGDFLKDTNEKYGRTLDLFTGTRAPAAGPKTQGTAGGDDFPADYKALKLTVIRPVFEKIGSMLKERGHDIDISEDAHGKISIHIVPAGVSKSIHAYDWFPTFSVIGAPYTKTVGLQGRNARRNSEGSTGSRGDHKPAQLSQEMVEKELMKFIGEIANW